MTTFRENQVDVGSGKGPWLLNLIAILNLLFLILVHVKGIMMRMQCRSVWLVTSKTLYKRIIFQINN